ncbi:MAG: TldD/PmbA family protein [Planctomycetota bacterium]
MVTGSTEAAAEIGTDAIAERAQELLGRAMDAGAGEAEVFAQTGRSLSAKMEKGDLSQVQADESSILGLRVFVDGRLGFASTNQTDPDSLAAVATDAVAIARLSPPDEANVLPDPEAVDDAARLGHRMDPALASVGVGEVVERAQALAARAAEPDPRISIDVASYSVVAGASVVLSSKGVDQRDRDAALTMSLMGFATDGDDTGGMDYRGAVVRDAADVDGELARVADEVARATVGNLGATSGESYRGAVAFAPAALASAILGPLFGSASAIAVQRGRSALAGKIGEMVAPGIQVIDDPTDRASGGARAYDREGLPARRFALVEDGRLRSFFHNTYSATVDGTRSTGHAQGGARGVPGLGLHACVVGPTAADAPADEEAVLAALGSGLYVQRFSGSVDAASGDFSGTAKSARWVEDGQVVRSVREVMLSGNAFEVLGAGVTLSRAQEKLGGSSRVSWGLVEGVSVTAG